MTQLTLKPLALVTGVGPGTGTSLVRRFAEGGYRVAMMARDADRLAALEAEIPDAVAVPCDVTDARALERAISDIGPPRVVVHNAVGGAFGTFLEIEPTVLQHNFDVNVMALLRLAQLTTPAMVEAGVRCLDRHGQYVRVTRQGEVRRFRTDQGGAAHPCGVFGARSGVQGGACGLSGDRCRDRRTLGAGNVVRGTG